MRSLLLSFFALSLATTALASDHGIERVARQFAWLLGTEDFGAFKDLAADSSMPMTAWGSVRAAFDMGECISVLGARATVLSETDHEADVIVVVDSTWVARSNHRPDRDLNPWWLHLRRSDRGWRVEWVLRAVRRLSRAFVAGEKEWEQARAGEALVDPSSFAYALANEASTRHDVWDRCILAIDYAESIARDVRDDTVVAFCDVARARVAWHQKDYAQAIRWGEKALAEARSTGDPDTIAVALFALGLAELNNESPEKALAHFNESAALLPQLTNVRIAIASADNATSVYFRHHDYRGAIASAHRAHDLAHQHRWHEVEVNSLQHLGEIHNDLRDFAGARQYFEQAAAVARDAQNYARLADALAGMAGDDLELGDVALSTQHFQEALKWSKGFSEAAAANIRNLCAAALLREGRFDEAETMITESLDLARRGKEGGVAAEALTALSTLRLRQRRYDDAIRLAREALVQTHENDMFASSPSATWGAQVALAQAFRATGRVEEAVQALRKAIETIEFARGDVAGTVGEPLHFLADKVEPYHALIEILTRQRRFREALAIAERLRGRLLIDSFDGRDRELSLTGDERKRGAELERRLAEMNRAIMSAGAAGDHEKVLVLRGDLESARLDLDRFDQETGIVHAAAHARHVSASQEEPALPTRLEGTAVIQYVVTERETIVFALRGRELTARILPIGRKELARRIDSFCHRIESRDLDYRDDARTLYAQLVLPVEPAIRSARTVAIIPDAELWRLPFHALIRANDQFVIKRFAVFYAPSLTILRDAGRKSDSGRHGRTLLAFGNPVVSGTAAAELRDAGYEGAVGPLPDAEREVRTIAALYGREQSRFYVRGAANEDAFKKEAPQYDILHLATHGFLDDHAPMYSALLLAPTPEDPASDGLLDTREILRMRLRASVVVLAACNTGRGATGPGEGVIGVSWAFLMAGCPTTVVTQWKASSTATASLMVDFHRGLARREGSVPALRAAQLRMLRARRFAHPYYWAPFVVIGAP